MRVEWTASAYEDRIRILEFIAVDSPNAARRNDERIRAETAELGRYPQIGRPGRMQNTRELVISNSPYIVVYAIEENMIVVLRVLHAAQTWPSESTGS
jgi:toxin ParE1/3/4